MNDIMNICMYGSRRHHSFLDRSRVWTRDTSLEQKKHCNLTKYHKISKPIHFIQSSGAYGSTQPLHAEDPL